MNNQLRLWQDRPTAETILAVFTPDDTALTRSQIAARLGTGKTKLLINCLEQMCQDGVLRRFDVALQNGVTAYAYERT